MTKLTFPFTEEEIRALKVGDEVSISGIVHAGCYPSSKTRGHEPNIQTDAASTSWICCD
jgi:hypothetical protein